MQFLTLAIAHKIERKFAADYAEYLEECEFDRAKGHRPHYCEHGVNLWADYDNICGACEDGISMRDGITRRAAAISEAKARRAKFDRAMSAVRELESLRMIDRDTRDELVSAAVAFVAV